MSSSSSLTLTQQGFDAWRRGDFDALEAIFAPEVEWHWELEWADMTGAPPVSHGVDEVIDTARRFLLRIWESYSVEAEEVFFASLLDMVGRPFRHEAENRKLAFEMQVDPHLTRSLVTDSKRLQQVLKNLLSNAFKFTEQGGVLLLVSAAASGWGKG